MRIRLYRRLFLFRLHEVRATFPALGGWSPWWNAGAIAEFFPLKDSDALRVHAYVAYDSLYNAFLLKVGARYNLTFKLW